ncbi:restriction methylase [Escherichia coli Nissle 1917]|nr:restriction methylase [Escherichia coli Nissle 1917]
MSAITVSRPEVVNGHTDVICSTSIRHILAVRKSTLLQIDTLIRQLAEISVLTESIGGKTALDWAMKQDFRCGCWLMEKPETAMKAITRNLDREIWRDLMQHSGMLSLMDAQAHDTWYRSLEYDNFPEISEANILSTFEQLHQNKDDVFERGVINLFRGLSWNYKTNCPCKFGLPSGSGQRAYGRYLLNQYPPHSGCTKECAAANRHTYPATGRNLSTDRKYWR